MGTSFDEMLKHEIVPFLSPQIRDLFLKINTERCQQLEEVRLRCGQPLMLKIGDRDWLVSCRGELQQNPEAAYVVQEEDIHRSILAISDNSLYAFAEEIRRGFITIPGGHRVGLAGQVVLEHDEIKTMKNFSGLSFRIAREIRSCSNPLLPHIYQERTVPVSTLFIAAPRCGKTTILRDITRNISNGSRWGPPCNVSLIDERSELAGCWQGKAQMDVGSRTDVLDACPKALGMMMAIRSLGPQVIVCDEIGRKEDADALQECVNAGVSVISSVHARDLNEARKRPLLKEVLAAGAFKMLITLSRRQGPGTVEEMVRWDL